MTASPTAHPEEHRWRARPGSATALRLGLLGMPFVASSAAIWLAAQAVPDRTWWGLPALLLFGLVVAVAAERRARRLLPVALLLKLSMVFPDRAPSRFALARTAVARQGQAPASGAGSRTSDLVLHLVTALGQHDRRSRGHSERVRVLVDMLAAEVGLDTDGRERLRWAALLHDVGKVEVPARVLNKAGPLDRAEFDTVRLHPAAGAALAAPLLPWLASWGDGILDHHEKYDGSGYPAGKAGEQISLAGRMVGLVDAFETMTAARPYKKAMAVRAAREELARCAGSHFDPVLVRAFLAISLPQVLWAMGPLSFLLQLPFLRPLADAGSRTSVAAPQAAASLAQGAAGAAGAAVLATGGLVGGGLTDGGLTDGGLTDVHDGAPRPAVVSTLPTPPTARAGAADVPAVAAASPLPAPGRAQTPSPAGGRGASSSGTGSRAPGRPAGAGASAGTAARPAAGAAAAPGTAATPGPTPVAPAPPPAPPSASPSPAPAVQPAPGHPAIADGPPAETSAREASFTLVAGGPWECQLQGNGDGGDSSWRPCSGTFAVTVLRDGDHVLRVRDAASRELVDTWSWTVTPVRRDG